MGGGEVKVATVDVEGGDNMATLPVSRSHTAGSTDSAEKNNAANKEMELKNVMPQPLQRCDKCDMERWRDGQMERKIDRVREKEGNTGDRQ